MNKVNSIDFKEWSKRAIAYADNLQKTSQRYGHGNYIEDLLGYIQENVVFPLQQPSQQPEIVEELKAALKRAHLQIIEGYKAASQQPEIIAGYIHEIDSLRETNRKLGEQIEELKNKNQ